jgi:hypothetical protein
VFSYGGADTEELFINSAADYTFPAFAIDCRYV